jgi:glycolate permease/lactate permease
MPFPLLANTTLFGAASGLWPLAWIAFNAVFFHNVVVASGRFDSIRASLSMMAPDQRLQVLIIAFCFGSLLEGIAGGGAPIAICAAILASLGFTPVVAVLLPLLANTAPVAFGGLGNPIITLGRVTAPVLGFPDDPNHVINVMTIAVGRQLPLISFFIPALLVLVMSGWKGLRGVLPAVFATGGAFALTQLICAQFMGPELIDVLSSLAGLGVLGILLRFWRPSDGWTPKSAAEETPLAASATTQTMTGREVMAAWLPYVVLIVLIVLSRIGNLIPSLPLALNPTKWLQAATLTFPWPGLDGAVKRMPPIVTEASPYSATFAFDLLYSPGSIALLAAVVVVLLARLPLREFAKTWWATAKQMKFAIVTITSFLAIAYVMNYSGSTATLALAMAATGLALPFFAPFIGWLGVMLTGSDAASNALFGPMQVFSAQQVGLDPVLMASINATGGVMGKMASPQSIAIGAAAVGLAGQEGEFVRATLKWSLGLTVLVGLIALAQAYLIPFIVPAL